MDELYDYLLPYYKAGLDGVIVQDIGAISYIREHFPEMPVHASTQMTITNTLGAEYLKRYGITRVVPARELSLEEIEEMKKAAEDFKKILKSKDITEIAEADVRFHDIIYMATDNQKLIQLLNNLREQMYRYRVEYLKREEAHPQLIAEHAAIIEHISKGEKKAATDIMCKHIDNQVTTVIDVIRTKQS